MNSYLFIILDKFQPKLSKTISFQSDLTPKKAFQSAVLEHGVPGWVEEYGFDPNVWYKDDISSEVCRKSNLITHDGRERSLLLVKLEN